MIHMDDKNSKSDNVDNEIEKVKDLANKVLEKVKKQDEFFMKFLNDKRIHQGIRDNYAVEYNKFMHNDKENKEEG